MEEGCSGSSVGTEINNMQLPVESDKVKNGRWSLNRDQAVLREWIFNADQWQKINVLLLFHCFPTVLSQVAIIFFLTPWMHFFLINFFFLLLLFASEEALPFQLWLKVLHWSHMSYRVQFNPSEAFKDKVSRHWLNPGLGKITLSVKIPHRKTF